ncbi:T9SS type A sorting domain-containing protein [Calditrichota bacterium]
MEEEEGERVATLPRIYHEFVTPSIYPELRPTGEDMSILVLASENIDSEIGIYSGDLLVGSGVITDGKVGIPVRGDDPLTSTIEGAITGDGLYIRLHNGSDEMTPSYSVLHGELIYQVDGLAVVELTDDLPEIADEFGLVRVYPNPFNSTTRIDYTLLETADINLSVFDLNGRHIKTIYSGYKPAGSIEATFDAGSLPSGLYLLELKAGANSSRTKLLLVR